MSTHLASNLRWLRMQRKATQDVVAGALEVKRSSYSGYENGAAEPGLELLVRMGDYFRISLSFLLRVDLCKWPVHKLEEYQRSYMWAVDIKNQEHVDTQHQRAYTS